MSLLHLLPTSNLLLQSTLALSLYALLSLLHIPVLFLHALHTYIHPDDVPAAPTSANGVRAAIRRPGSDPDPKPRKRSKPSFEFDENKAQIFRLKLTHAHLQSRLYFNQFNAAFSSTAIALSSLLLHRFLPKSESSGIISNGAIIPVLLGFATVCRLLVFITRVSFERSASKRSEKQLSVLLGILGFVLGLMIVLEIVPNFVIGFGFGFLDGFGKFLVAGLMGGTAGLLFMPAGRNARSFWLGTDQIRCNLPIIHCGWFARMLLYANQLLVMFTSLLWIGPFANILVNMNADNRKGANLIGDVDQLVGNVGMLKSDFDKFRVWCLLASGLLQIITLRSNLQMYLNEAVLSWYQRLHSSKVPDLEYSRAKVFLHNHYLCLVVLQFFGPPALVLLFLGLSQVDGKLFKDLQPVCSLLPCSDLVKEIPLFMAWWITFVWGIFTLASIVVYRRGILYVS
ncbi:uncharacterized protein LOC131321055 [Rhododendron vialii]|uniref:uncharacterized protein LOC131321055 n=1 Tax=Rhododendron vialii TaxID=182163 RepID=UPI00265DD0A0|nr:uncharacterized protein LOC131321055 [Rhododendron vialii]